MTAMEKEWVKEGKKRRKMHAARSIAVRSDASSASDLVCDYLINSILRIVSKPLTRRRYK